MRRRNAGMTLMELLIVVTLVSLLSMGMLFAIRTGMDAMSRTTRKFTTTRRVLGAQRVLEQQIAGFMYVPGACVVQPGAPVMPVPFFQGEASTMRFVTSYSIQEAARGFPRLAEFQVIPGDQGRGVRLVVNEHLYTGTATTTGLCVGLMPDPATGLPAPIFRPVTIGTNSFVLADKLAFCRVFYREEMPAPLVERWVQRWVKPEAPTAIRIEMAPLELDPGNVQVMTVTAPVHVNRLAMTKYTD